MQQNQVKLLLTAVSVKAVGLVNCGTTILLAKYRWLTKTRKFVAKRRYFIRFGKNPSMMMSSSKVYLWRSVSRDLRVPPEGD